MVDVGSIVWYSHGMTIEITAVIIAGTLIAILNFLSVYAAIGLLRWKDHRHKKAIADIFMREVGEKLQTEANFQDIIQNMNLGTIKKDDEDDNNQ
jgi:hypothetical protein